MTKVQLVLSVASLAWVIGWIVCTIILVVFASKNAAEAGKPFAWLSTLSRIFLLGVFWPLYIAIGLILFFKEKASLEDDATESQCTQ